MLAARHHGAAWRARAVTQTVTQTVTQAVTQTVTLVETQAVTLAGSNEAWLLELSETSALLASVVRECLRART